MPRILIGHYPQKPNYHKGRPYFIGPKCRPSHSPGSVVTRFDNRQYVVQDDGSIRRK